MRISRLARFSWAVLAYNLLVILWGAWVRVTGSGAGCGSHWPTCNGEVIPRSPTAQTLVELTHRLTSGIDGLLVLALFVCVLRARPKGDPTRLAATASLVFLLLEAAIGAGLVKFELVATDASAARAYVMSVHLVNTLLLLGALTRTSWLLSRGRPRVAPSGGPGRWLLAARLGLVAVVITGGIAALGDTLFPAGSLAEGLAQDVAPSAPMLLRLRVIHPFVAIVVGAVAIAAAAHAASTMQSAPVRRMAAAVSALVVVQLVAGMVNVVLLAPGWLQLVHLLLADLLWIGAVVLGLEVRLAATAAATAGENSSGRSLEDAASAPAVAARRPL